MKITHNKEPKGFAPFSVTITFESAQEAINLLHYFNIRNLSELQRLMNEKHHGQIPDYTIISDDNSLIYSDYENILKSKGII